MSGQHSEALERFFQYGCRQRPDCPPTPQHILDGIRSAFVEVRHCKAHGEYRGANCWKCTWEGNGWSIEMPDKARLYGD